MLQESKNMDSFVGNEIKFPGAKLHQKSGISVFVDKVHSVNGLYLIAAISQIMLGLSVVALSLTGAIRPVWVSTLMTVAGSTATVVGIFFLYSIFRKEGTFDSLLRKSIRRVIEEQN